MILLTLGIIIGLLIAIFVAILHKRFENNVNRTLPLIEAKMENIFGKENAYIIGLSEDEEVHAKELQAEIKSEKIS